MSNIKITWDKIEDLVFTIKNEMDKHGLHPSIIVPILRGGMVPARIMSNYFENAKIIPITAKLYHGKEQYQTVVVENFTSFYSELQERKVLIIDDISDSGKTLTAVSSKFFNDCKMLQNEWVKTATLFYRKGSIFKPDFYGEKIEHDSWLDFPWERKLNEDKKQD